MILTTDRLTLRDFIEGDYCRVNEYRSDERYLRYYHEEARTEAGARTFESLVMGWAAEVPRRNFQLAIVRTSDNLLIGNCGVRTTSAVDREAEFGCELDPHAWRQGYATEAGRAILSYAFDFLGMHRVWSRTIAENRSAVRLAERLGMGLEGCLRESNFFRERWWDNLVYAILEQDWRNTPRRVGEEGKEK